MFHFEYPVSQQESSGPQHEFQKSDVLTTLMAWSSLFSIIRPISSQVCSSGMYSRIMPAVPA